MVTDEEKKSNAQNKLGLLPTWKRCDTFELLACHVMSQLPFMIVSFVGVNHQKIMACYEFE